MLDSLFGTQLGTTAKFAAAFLLVLALIGITALILKRFGGNRMPSSGGGRNRQPRLSVLDSAVVDAKRRLVLIRRDNSEHLLLIGGPTDVVVETNINRAGPATPATRGRGPQQPDLEALESALLPEISFDEPAPPAPRAPQPAPQPAPRTPQPAPVAREAAPRPQPRLPEPVQELTVAPPLRPEPQPAAFSPPPPLPPRPAAPQPSAPAAAAAPAPAPAPRVDPDYADIHAKMEAALRNTMAASAPRAPQPATPPRPAAPPAPPPPMPHTRAMPASPAPAVSQPVVQKTPATDAPNPFDSLEAEMASLLGQDKKR